MIGKLGAVAAIVMGLAMSPVAKAGDSNGNFQIKAGYTGIIWDDRNHGIAVNGATLAGSNAAARDLALPTATLTYYLTKNIGLELFCCFAHAKVHATGTLNALGDVANAWTFPPILTLQYHFDGMGPIRPYVGVGAQWVHFFNERSTIGGFNKADFKDSFGLAAQVGVDYDLGSGWSLGLDVKKVWEDTKITWSATNGDRITTRHDLDPLLITANVGYRFNLFGAAAAAPLK
jgi:outer membrane protein